MKIDLDTAQLAGWARGHFWTLVLAAMGFVYYSLMRGLWNLANWEGKCWVLALNAAVVLIAFIVVLINIQDIKQGRFGSLR